MCSWPCRSRRRYGFHSKTVIHKWQCGCSGRCSIEHQAGLICMRVNWSKKYLWTKLKPHEASRHARSDCDWGRLRSWSLTLACSKSSLTSRFSFQLQRWTDNPGDWRVEDHSQIWQDRRINQFCDLFQLTERRTQYLSLTYCFWIYSEQPIFWRIRKFFF